MTARAALLAVLVAGAAAESAKAAEICAVAELCQRGMECQEAPRPLEMRISGIPGGLQMDVNGEALPMMTLAISDGTESYAGASPDGDTWLFTLTERGEFRLTSHDLAQPRVSFTFMGTCTPE